MKNVILYGAGSDLSKILPLIKANGWKPICIADSNINKMGTFIYNIPVVSPESITNYDSKIIIITASFFDSINAKIKEITKDNYDDYTILVSPYAWLMLVNVEYNEELLAKASAFTISHQKEILNIYDCNDETTKNIITFLSNARISNSYRFYDYSQIKGLQYVEGYFFQNELSNIKDGFTFIDIGAYTGDTYLSMSSTYKEMIKYFAYEPSTENFNKLLSTLSSQKMDNSCEIQCKNYALGESNGFIEMGKSDGEFGIVDNNNSSNSQKIRVKQLDDENISVSGKLVIKMDVEGAELSVLKGAKKIIKEYHPIMAICVYHKYQDIYELPKYIVDLGVEYRFVLRAGIHTHLLAFPKG